MGVGRDVDCEKGIPFARAWVLLGDGAVTVWGCPQMDEAGILLSSVACFPLWYCESSSTDMKRVRRKFRSRFRVFADS